MNLSYRATFYILMHFPCIYKKKSSQTIDHIKQVLFTISERSESLPTNFGVGWSAYRVFY